VQSNRCALVVELSEVEALRITEFANRFCYVEMHLTIIHDTIVASLLRGGLIGLMILSYELYFKKVDTGDLYLSAIPQD
jgi:hypothetical protein